MCMLVKILFCIFVLSLVHCEKKEFPQRFSFGVGSSSYQIEGAWNVSDKAESNIDRFFHRPVSESFIGGANGDVATNSYHKWRRDVEMLAEIHVDYYRFSISWSRILPTGFPNKISKDGKKYYNDLIDALLVKGIEPVVTIYHWDMPQKLQELGGWMNPLMTDWIADYAKVLYELYGDRVKTWITINEPINMCDLNYATGMLPPGIIEPDYSGYLCSKHVLIAHAKMYRKYDEEFRHKYHGKVGLTQHYLWVEPRSEEYSELTELVNEYVNNRYAHPIFSKDGGWPPKVEKMIKDYSLKIGLQRSLLPTFSEEEILLIKGTYDFVGVNYYSARLVRPAEPGEEISEWYVSGIKELDAVLEVDEDWPYLNFLISLYPEGLRKEMSWIKQTHGEDIQILITENGYCTPDSGVLDRERSQFIDDNLEQIWLAINEDNVNVIGYTYWSLMDSFEWFDGYPLYFGLYATNYSCPELTRTPRASAHHYHHIIKNRAVDID